MGLLLAALAIGLVVGALALWFRRIQQVAVGGHRRVPYAMIGAGMLLAVAAFASGPGTLGGWLAGLALVLGVVWFALGALAPQSRQPPAVRIGEPALDFTAPDHRGEPFRLSSLAGKPVLLKFFRGHW